MNEASNYKNWSIRIRCERLDEHFPSTSFTAVAIVIYEGLNPAFETTSSECFIASLPGASFPQPEDANDAVLQEAKRRINALPIHLPAALRSFPNRTQTE